MDTKLTIATYNIHDGREPEVLVKTIQSLVLEGVDIICLQEVRGLYKGIDFGKVLQEKLGAGIQAEYFLPQSPNSLNYGLGIIWLSSALIPISFARLPLPILPKFRLWEKAFFKWHGLPFIPNERGALVGTFNVNGKILRITNVHLDFQGGPEQRSKQIRHVRNYLDSQGPTDHEIICGDFNTIGIFGHAVKTRIIQSLLGAGFNSVFSKSYSTVAMHQQLDYIFVKNLQVDAAKICKLPGSDHLPILANLSF